MDDREFRWPGFDPGDPAHRALQGWLVLDVQHQPQLAAELRDHVRAAMAGDVTHPGGAGNGYEYDFEPEGLRLAGLYPGEDADPATVPYGTADAALAAWLAYLAAGV